MKHLLKIALTMIAAITIGTSCNENNTTPTYSTFLTVVEGSWDIPYYLVFDDGTTAAVENHKDWTPSFTEDWKELRYIVYYTETDLVEPGYDKVVNITAYQPVAVSKLENVTDENFTGDKGLQKYTAKLDISEAFFSPARNYITMSMLIPYIERHFFGQLVKWLNTPPFHGGIHGFESRTCHHWFPSSVGRASDS